MPSPAIASVRAGARAAKGDGGEGHSFQVRIESKRRAISPEPAEQALPSPVVLRISRPVIRRAEPNKFVPVVKGCIHFPFHDSEAINNRYQVLDIMRPSRVVDLGDLLAALRSPTTRTLTSASPSPSLPPPLSRAKRRPRSLPQTLTLSREDPMKNPFAPAAKISPRVKAMLYGAAGVGKSHLAVEAAISLASAENKRAAAISMEGGLEYLPSKGYDFDLLATKSYADTIEAIDFLLSPAGERTYGAVVVDPVTILYQIVQEAQQDIVERREMKKQERYRRVAAEVTLGYREWGKVKAQMDKLATRLVNAPQHILVTAREAIEYKQSGSNLESVGFKAETPKSWPFLFDFVGRITADGGKRAMVVDKDRFSQIGEVGEVIHNPTATLFNFAAGDATAWKQICDVAAAAAKEADQEEAPLASDETMKKIEETVAQIERLDSEAGAKARTWLGEKLLFIAMSEAAAAKVLENLESKARGLQEVALAA